MDARVRKATVDDAEQVSAVLNSVIAEGMLTLFDRPFPVAEERTFIAALSPRSALHVAELESRILGVQSIDLYSDLSQSTSHVATMGTWLRGEARGHGIGKLLAMESFRFATSNGYAKIVIHVLAGNERALRFYRRLGFVDVGVLRRHVRLGGTFHDEVCLEKLL